MALTTWNAALVNRLSTPARVLCIGDSTTEGQGVGTTNHAGPDGWQWRLRDAIRTRYPGGGTGEGWNAPQGAGVAADWTFASTSDGSSRGIGMRGIALNAGGSMTRTGVVGTKFRVHYAVTATGGGTLALRIDGVTISSVSTTGTASEDNTLSVDIPTGTHTVAAVNTAGSGVVYVSNAGILNGEETAGIEWWGAGKGGTTVADFLAQNGGAGPWEIPQIDPHLVTIQLGANEMFQATTGAVFQANLETMIDRIRARSTTNPSILLICNWDWGANWATYANAMTAVTASRSVDMFDLRTLSWVSADQETGNGYHRSDVGNSKTADALLDVVAPISSMPPVSGYSWREYVSGVENILTLEGEYVSATSTVKSTAFEQVIGDAVVNPDGVQAATLFGWGAPLSTSDEFNYVGLPDPAKWGNAGTLASGGWPGNGGVGRRIAEQSQVDGTKLVMTGSPNGDTGWLSHTTIRQYGAWECRARSYNVGASGFTYHPLFIIWPLVGTWPDDGEYDFLENDGPGQAVATAWIHYPHPSTIPIQQEGPFTTACDMTQWHNFAINWRSTGITVYIDGVLWYSVSDGAIGGTRSNIQAMPLGGLTIQLDNFGSTSGNREARFEVAWVRVYS